MPAHKTHNRTVEINITFKRSLSKEEIVGLVCTKKIKVFLSLTASEAEQEPAILKTISFFGPTSGTNAVTQTSPLASSWVGQSSMGNLCWVRTEAILLHRYIALRRNVTKQRLESIGEVLSFSLK